MFQTRRKLVVAPALVLLAAAVLLVGCESGEFADAPTVRAPTKGSAKAVEPRSQQPRSPKTQLRRQDMPADHPPVGQASGGPARGSNAPAMADQGGPAKGTPPAKFGKVGPLRWEAPKSWKAVKPASSMRLAEYRLPADSGQPATMTVFYFGKAGGGSIQANIDRWVGQFASIDGKPAQEERTSNGLKVHLVDVSGTFNAGSMGSGDPREGWQMRGAIVESPAGNFFFKVTGPKATVAAHDRGFESCVSSFKAGGAY